MIILGQGSAAFAAAIRANDLGIKTAMVGGNSTPGTLIGGTCVNVGCMPSKHLIKVGTLFYQAANNGFEGIKYETGKVDFKKMVKQKDELVRKFRKEKYEEVLKALEHIEFIPGKGRFVSRNEIEVGKRRIRAKKFVIAVGARAQIIPIPGIEKVDYLTNEEALNLKELPKSMVVIGGRALGLEFAQMFAHLGTKVTVLQRSERIIPEGEPEISDALKTYLEDEGVTVHTGMKINKVERKGRINLLSVTAGGKTFNIECEQLLLKIHHKSYQNLLNNLQSELA